MRNIGFPTTYVQVVAPKLNQITDRLLARIFAPDLPDERKSC